MKRTKTWPGQLGLMVCLISLLSGAGLSVQAQSRDPRPVRVTSPSQRPVLRIPITGVIELGLAPFVERSLHEAEKADAAAVILDIDTPGGRVDAAQRIVDAIRESDIPVYAYVNHRAYSAGAMVALAADRIYMRPGSVMGAATPVTGEGQKAPEKIVSAMRSEMRSLAEERGLDPKIAEAMVDEDVDLPGLAPKGKLLTLTTADAVRVRYAQEVSGLDALLGQLGLARAEVREGQVNWAERIVRFVTHPAVAPLLLSLGVLGLIIEIKTPSFGLAGGVGLLSLGLFFGSHFLIGLAGWEELILVGVGLGLLAMEAFIVPGFGIFGIAGTGALLGGVFFSLVTNLSTPAEYSQAAGVVTAALALVLVGAWALVKLLPGSSRLRRSGVMLGEATTRQAGYLSTPLREELVGAEGIAETDLRPVGAGRFGDERIEVVAEGGWIPAGSPIRIVRAEGYHHVVRSVSAGA